MTQICAPAIPLADDVDFDISFDISHEMAILYGLVDQPQAPRRRRFRAAWPSLAAVTLALGWGGAAYAERATYTVAPGETLYQIAGRHLGSGTRWVEIAALNDIKDPAKVQVGQAIVLPDRRERIAVAPAERAAGRAARRAETRGSAGAVSTAARTAAARARAARLPRTVHVARGIGQTHDGVPIVPAGDVVLELPARKVEVRPAAARSQFSRPVAAERVRPQQEAEIAAPLPAPLAKDPVSPWRAVDGAAFLLGALGVTGLLTRTRTRATRRNPQAQWQAAAQALAREAEAATPVPAFQPAFQASSTGNQAPDFWGPLQGTDLSRLAVSAPAR